MDELFKTEESLSPQRRYIKESGFITWQVADQEGGDGEWIASISGEASDQFEEAASEIEAVSKLNAITGRMAQYEKWRIENGI